MEDELSKARDSFADGKSLGEDGIPVEVIQ